MGGKKSTTKQIRKLGKTGNADSPSYFLTIPIEIVRTMGWHDGQNVLVKKSRGKVVIETYEGPASKTEFGDDGSVI